MTSAAIHVSVGPADFDLGHECQLLRAGRPGVGAVVSFVGTVRDGAGGDPVSALELEHYPGMTERALEAICAEAVTRWSPEAIRVIHRVGRLNAGEQIVLVAVAGVHRGAAFEACEFLMDYLKTRAPFWKKESGPGGTRWVEARLSDDEAAARWATGAAGMRSGPDDEAPRRR